MRLPGARRDFVEQLQKVGQEAMRKDVRDSDKPAKTLIPTSPKRSQHMILQVLANVSQIAGWRHSSTGKIARWRKVWSALSYTTMPVSSVTFESQLEVSKAGQVLTKAAVIFTTLHLHNVARDRRVRRSGETYQLLSSRLLALCITRSKHKTTSSKTSHSSNKVTCSRRIFCQRLPAKCL